MIKPLIVLPLLLAAYGCRVDEKKTAVLPGVPQRVTRMYSQHVRDTFSVFVSLPDGVKNEGPERYPVVIVLDGNFYFDMVAPVLNGYARGGLLPPCIVVGVGYRDLEMMDDLRGRDFTYPEALPEYEMSASGGAPLFLRFLEEELLPFVSSRFPADPDKVTLAGHSLGGLFVLYALNDQLNSGKKLFSGFISASPSVHYNNYVIVDQLRRCAGKDKRMKCYLTFGGEDDLEEETEPGSPAPEQVMAALDSCFAGRVSYKITRFPGLGHMDTPLPTITKGLQQISGN